MIKKSLVFLSLFLIPMAVFAGLTVRPSRIELKLPAGETYRGSYSVRNDFSSAAVIKIETRDWFLLPENAGMSVSDWLSIPEKEFYVRSGESHTVNYEVNVPTAAQGALVGMVSFIPSPEEEQGVTLMLSASMFVTVTGTEKREWELVNPKATRSPMGTQFSIEVVNKGNIHIRPTGSVSIISKDAEVKAIELIESRPVYPGSSRTVVTPPQQDLGLVPGSYRIQFNVVCGEEKKQTLLKMTVTKTGEIEFL